MGLGRAIARAFVGCLLATTIGVFAGAIVMPALALVPGHGQADWPTLGEIVKGIVFISVFGMIFAVPFAMPIGLPLWFLMDRYGRLGRRSGAIAGMVVGLVVTLPHFGIFSAVGALSGALAGWASVRLTDRWIPRRSRKAPT